MAEVPGSPYQPVFTGEVPERRTVFQTPNVPAAAFGTDVARAIATFGGDVKQAGEDVFRGAMDWRKMQMEMGIRDASTALQDDVSKIQEAYLQKKGNLANPEAMEAHSAALNQKRLTARAAAVAQWGPQGGNMFDADNAGMFRSFNREALAHTARETQRAQVGSINNRAAVSKNLAASTPWDDRTFEEQVDARNDQEEDLGNLNGLGAEEIDFNQKNAVNELAKLRIAAAANADTSGMGAAYELLQKMKANGYLSNEGDIEDAEKAVRARFFASSDAVIKSREREMLDEYRAYGFPTAKAQRLQAEIEGLEGRRINIGEAKEIVDATREERQAHIEAAQMAFTTKRQLQGTSPFQPLIDRSAADHGVNPVLLARLLHQESGLNPNVGVSSAGAQGIAQFMPQTARQYGVDVRSVPSSIEGAAHYLEDLTNDFGGNVGLAVAAYNWGPANVHRWVDGGAKPNAMPKETRDYVRNITGQSAGDWAAGDYADISKLSYPPTSAGGVQKAMEHIRNMEDDPNISESQKQLNRTAGERVVKQFIEDNIKLAHTGEMKQKLVDDRFESDVIARSNKPDSPWDENSIRALPDEEHGGPSSASKLRMMKFLTTENLPGPPRQVSNANAISLYRRVIAPEGDPQKITRRSDLVDAATEGRINRQDMDWLLKKFDEPTTPEGERISRIRNRLSEAVAADLDKSLVGAVDSSGRLQHYMWERDLDDAIEQRRKDGKDPADLLDPHKPEFFGRDEVLQRYRVPLDQAVRNVQNRITGGGAAPAPTAPSVTAAPGISGVTPAFGAPGPGQRPQSPARRPGESTMQYMDRTVPRGPIREAPLTLGPGQM